MWFVKRSSGVGVCQRHRNIAIINGGKSHFAEQTGSKLWLQWGVGCLFSTPALLVITHADWYSCGAMSSWKGLWTRLAVSAYKDRCVCWEWVGTTCRGEGIGYFHPLEVQSSKRLRICMLGKVFDALDPEKYSLLTTRQQSSACVSTASCHCYGTAVSDPSDT